MIVGKHRSLLWGHPEDSGVTVLLECQTHYFGGWIFSVAVHPGLADIHHAAGFKIEGDHQSLRFPRRIPSSFRFMLLSSCSCSRSESMVRLRSIICQPTNSTTSRVKMQRTSINFSRADGGPGFHTRATRA